MSQLKNVDMDQHLLDRIQPVLSRANRLRFFNGLSLVWLASALIALALLVSNYSGGSYFPPMTLLPICGVVFLLATLTWIGWWFFTRNTAEDVARLIEQRYEELDSSLLTAIEQRPDKKTGLYNFLQYDVIRNAVYHSYKEPWRAVIPAWRGIIAPISAVASLVAFLGFLGLYWLSAKPLVIDPTIVDFNQVVSGGQNYSLVVEPGDAQVEAGSGLMVLARFGEHLPPGATVVVQSSNAQGEATEEIQIPMSKSLADPIFGCRIPDIGGPLTYRVDFADQSSESFEVSVFRYPKLVRNDAELSYPTFTKLADKTIQDVRRISAVAGTELTLKCYLNKSVATAQLKSRDGTVIDLQPGPESNQYEAKLLLQESQKLQLLLTDDQGRRNKSPANLTIKVTQNRAPDLKLVQPTSDLQVSPLEEIDMQASAWDDFGLGRVGLSYSIGGQAPMDIVLGEELPAKKQNAVNHLLPLETLNAEPDQLVSYHFWAEDLVRDNETRRTMGDMFFAEVRHFEEIFRQGQQQPGGQQQQPQQQPGQQGQNAQQAQELGELQKQIINATWKVIRTEITSVPSDKFSSDVDVISESQEAALQQLMQLADQIQDETAHSFVTNVRTNMEQAIGELGNAIENSDPKILNRAMAAEQKAYQGLLKLRAREHEVAMQNQSQMQQQQGGQQNNRSQQQLQQLQLNQDENRYETERQAQPEQNAEQQEDRQVLSRLRELARRQNDLNERIKELQSALDEAENKKEQEEIERELKRLQEEQEQILRDAEELQERMESEQNQQRMSEEAQQLEEARENIRKSNEALQNGELTQAAAEGTRAEREIRELRDEFQERTSSQFTEEMREMRDQARQLEDDQARIAEELKELERNPQQQTQSLTSGDVRQELTEELDDQQDKVEQLRENIRKTIEQAEEYEPLLAEELYDTYRQSEQDRPTDALETAEQWLRRGFDTDARLEQQQALESIERIREGVDKAAERVLGDETEALRRANQELERLNREINEEAREQAGGLFDDDRADEELSGEENPNSESERNNTRQNNQEPGSENPDRQPSDSAKQTGDPNRQQGENDQPNDDQDRPGQPGNSDQKKSDEQDREPQDGQQPGEGEQRPDGTRGRAVRPNLRDSQDRPQGDASGLGGDQREPIPATPANPLTGDDFLNWSDRLRDVEEMIPDQRMRAEATRIRENARQFRQELKRHSKEPNWELVKLKVIEPLAELQNLVADELIRRLASNEIVPVDRDPVPVQYEEAVRKYYEQLGTGK